MVTEEAHIELGEQPTEEVETSFKVVTQKKETIEEFVTLEQPSEEVQTSFKLAPQRQETVEEFVTLEQPVSESPKEVEEISQQVTLKPKKKKSVVEESITLEQPTESTVTLERTEVEEVQTSFKLAAQKKETIEEFVTLEQPSELPKQEVEEISQQITLKPKKKSVTEESITLEQPTSVTVQQEDLTQEVSLFRHFKIYNFILPDFQFTIILFGIQKFWIVMYSWCRP